MQFGEPNPQQNTNPSSWDLVINDLTNLNDIKPESFYAGLIFICAELIRVYEYDNGNAITEVEAIDTIKKLAKQRDDFGAAKYGTRLQPFNGRNAIKDCIEEALDLLVYYRTDMEERKYATS